MLKIRDVLVPARNVFCNVSDGMSIKRNGFLIQSPKFGLPHVTFKTTSTGTSKKSSLPKLPVPPLNQTLEKFMRSVTPLVSESELATTCKNVAEFSKKGGAGEKLQKLLEERARTTENWLSDWWLNAAYLDLRSTVVVHSSPGLVFPLQKFKSAEDQLKYASKMIAGALDYKKLIDENMIPDEKMGKEPLDMSQYYKVMGTCRIPGETKDRLTYADPEDPPQHIIVSHNNHMFKVDVYDDSCKPLGTSQLLSQLEAVVKCSKQKTLPIGILTTENRDVWGKAYKQLSGHVVNRCSLHEIQTSIFIVCIDGPNPAPSKMNEQTKAAVQMVHGMGSKGNGGNRWFDKTIQFVIGLEGGVGLTYEHSPAEGPPIANLMDHVVKFMANLDKGDGKKDCTPKPKSDKVPTPELLEFNIPENTKKQIETAECNLDQLVDDLHMDCFTFKTYGKEFIKSQKLSPDSFIQMAIQLAYYRLSEKPGAHYESASQRKFVFGRTETIRSCSCESLDFARNMLNKDASAECKVSKLAAAINGHKAYTIDALNGKGVDRHFLGMKLAAMKNNIKLPKLYQDAAFTRSNHFVISSSQVAAKCDAFMCYGPLVPDGYACCYNPRPDEIVFGLSAMRSAKGNDVTKFRASLEASLKEMQDALLKAQSQANSKCKL